MTITLHAGCVSALNSKVKHDHETCKKQLSTARGGVAKEGQKSHNETNWVSSLLRTGTTVGITNQLDWEIVMKRMISSLIGIAVGAVFLAGAASPAGADAVSDFYKNKRV
ncbi:MAG: hypothetical protein O7F75_09605, partial [Alphaproteobacteria bacterium]|nr:hypothetical protein [Alphaproteobacteria bacterium]